MAHYLDELIDRLNALDGREVTVTENHVRTDTDRTSRRIYDGEPDLDDLTERIMHRIGRILRREGLT